MRNTCAIVLGCLESCAAQPLLDVHCSLHIDYLLSQCPEAVLYSETFMGTHHKVLCTLTVNAAACVTISCFVLQGDTAAKAITLGWLHTGLTAEEEEIVVHWLSLMTKLLDLQDHQHIDGQQVLAHNEQQNKQQQSKQHSKQQKQQNPLVAEAGAGGQQAAAGDSELSVWLLQPENKQHHLRLLLECLKELGAMDLPARVLLSKKVQALSCSTIVTVMPAIDVTHLDPQKMDPVLSESTSSACRCFN